MENNIENNKFGNPKLIAGAIIIVGVLIAGAILLRGKTPTENKGVEAKNDNAALTQVGTVNTEDHVLGNADAKVTMVEYADYQCPFCGKFFKETTEPILNTYVKEGKVKFIYRDFAFLGPESFKSAEAVACAGDQNKYWEFHNFLFTHQNGENQGAFADTNLKTFAKQLGLDSATFDKCLDSGKYTQAVKDSTTKAGTYDVKGTPKSFIIKDGKVVDTVDGAYPLEAVKAKLDAALK